MQLTNAQKKIYIHRPRNLTFESSSEDSVDEVRAEDLEEDICNKQ
jgi:hypothetical protein